jgi:hypothetical protein
MHLVYCPRLMFVGMCSKKKLHNIGIAETFFRNGVNEAEISIYGYKCYRKDRYVVKEGRQGGVILYVKEDIVSYKIS